MGKTKKKHFDRIPDNAYYFSIDIQERRAHYSTMVPDMDYVTRISEGYGTYFLFEVLGSGADPVLFDMRLNDMLSEAEERYPERTCLSLTFFDEAFNVVEDYGGTSDNGYYCIGLDMDMRDVVRDFIRCVAEGKQLERIAKPLPGDEINYTA